MVSPEAKAEASQLAAFRIACVSPFKAKSRHPVAHDTSLQLQRSGKTDRSGFKVMSDDVDPSTLQVCSCPDVCCDLRSQ